MSNIIKIRNIPWMRDAEDDHKSNWHADSKGGEPNHYPEPTKEQDCETADRTS